MASSFSSNSDQFLSSLDAEIERLQQIRNQVADALGISAAPKKSVGRPRKQAFLVDEPKVRQMSEEGRRRIAEAQKARWAKQKKTVQKQGTRVAAQPVAAKEVVTKKAVATKVTPKKVATKSLPAKKVAAKKIVAKKVPAKKVSIPVPARKAAPAKKAPAKQVQTPVATSSGDTSTAV